MRKSNYYLMFCCVFLLLVGCKKDDEVLKPKEVEVVNEKDINVITEIKNTDNIVISNGYEEKKINDKKTPIEKTNMLYAWNKKTDNPVYYAIPTEKNQVLNAEETAYFMVIQTLPFVKFGQTENINRLKNEVKSLKSYSQLVEAINKQVKNYGSLKLTELIDELNLVTEEFVANKHNQFQDNTNAQSIATRSKQIDTYEVEFSGVRVVPKGNTYVPQNGTQKEYWKYNYDIINSHGIYLGAYVGNYDKTKGFFLAPNSQFKIIDPMSISEKTFWMLDGQQWKYFSNPVKYFHYFTNKTTECTFNFTENYNDLGIIGTRDGKVLLFNITTFVIEKMCDLLGMEGKALDEFVKSTVFDTVLLDIARKSTEDGKISKSELSEIYEQVFSKFKAYLLENLTKEFLKKAFAKEQISKAMLKNSFKSFDLTFQALDVSNMILSGFIFEPFIVDNKFVTDEKTETPTNGLVAYYPFNGNANDESGNGNNGKVNGAILTTDRHGNQNSAYSFDGVDDYIRVLGWNKLVYNQKRSISVWFNTNNHKLSNWVSWGSNQPNKLSQVGIFETGLGYLGFGNDVAISPTPYVNNEWHHLVVSFNGYKLYLFVDGILLKQQEINLNTGLSDLVIGTAITMYSQFYFEGILDDIRIYNRALTEEEVQALYKE